jgi:actin related protein 2/3 complex subunit 1A/1B
VKYSYTYGLEIYTGADKTEPSQWKKQCTLKKPSNSVTALDWSWDGKIVACCSDGMVFVWTKDKGEWGISFKKLFFQGTAALCAAWSADAMQCIVGFKNGGLGVYRYEESLCFWIPRKVKPHQGAVLSLSWHPNNQLIATTLADRTCRIFLITSVTCLASKKQWLKCVAQFDTGDYKATSCAWSSNGTILAFLGSCCTVTLKVGVYLCLYVPICASRSLCLSLHEW